MFAVRLWWDRGHRFGKPVRQKPLPSGVAIAAIVLPIAVLIPFCYLFVVSHTRYMYDAGYFVEQISKRADFGRKLYDGIEFPYGPLLFYPPIWIRAILTPLHVSLTAAYSLALLLEEMLGLLMLVYTTNSLPMARGWKILFIVLSTCLALPPNLGSNYTLFRFIAPCFFLVLARGRSLWTVVLVSLLGEICCLGISPEMGFSFLTASASLATYQVFAQGRRWFLAVAAPILAVPIFLLLAGTGYLRMLALFAHGLLNLVVEPEPHTIIFLFAVIWLVPSMLAQRFREHRTEAPLLCALYVSGLALLPVAFGRVDPPHVFYDGLAVYLLSFVAISSCGRLSRWLWGIAVSCLLLWTAYLNLTLSKTEYVTALNEGTVMDNRSRHLLQFVSRFVFKRRIDHHLAAHLQPLTIDEVALQQAIGNAPLATPLEIPLSVENQLKASGRYVPLFYCFQIAALDAAAETREVAEWNRFQWMLLPQPIEIGQAEWPETTQYLLGIQLPYHSKRQAYIAGPRLFQYLQGSWEPYASIGSYEIYRRR